MIQGTVQGKTPIEPVVMSDEERAKFGVEAGKLALFYPAGQEGVFFIAGRSDFTVWFSGEESEIATAKLHEALMRAFPMAKELDRPPAKSDPRVSARYYRVELGAGRLAAITASFARTGSGRGEFGAHISAQQRPS